VLAQTRIRAVFLLLAATYIAYGTEISGRVVDAVSGQPIPGAIVTSGNVTVRADANGAFRLSGARHQLFARAYGYGRTASSNSVSPAEPLLLKLEPFTPRAVYLSYWGVSSAAVREPVLRLAGSTPVNAIVVDVKGDLGYVSYHTAAPLANQIGAVKTITIPDIHAFLDRLHAQGIYAIGRIVTFKDNMLAASDPTLAVHLNGKIWHDREGLAWCDPFQRKVWDYNISLAVDAAKNGFDEIEFDYVRFPDTKGLQFSEDSTEDTRTATITAFLTEARKQLVPYNVFLSADVFGYICWNTTDTGIGQKIEKLGAVLDYISPMLYPSGFSFGIPNFRNPIANPYEIVRLSLDKGRERTGLAPIRFRPWLQAFADYAFDKRQFTTAEIQAQIRAAQSFGSDGWLLWNPRNSYSAATFGIPTKKQEPTKVAIAR
jgi:hypothetical protein